MENDDHTNILIGKNNKEEREISDKKYAPYLAWVILLGILTLFGAAIVNKIIVLIHL